MFDLTPTFDNGPDPDTTPAVLELLARENIRSTFFVLGDKISEPKCKRIAERAVIEGHWIGNHSTGIPNDDQRCNASVVI